MLISTSTQITAFLTEDAMAHQTGTSGSHYATLPYRITDRDTVTDRLNTSDFAKSCDQGLTRP